MERSGSKLVLIFFGSEHRIMNHTEGNFRRNLWYFWTRTYRTRNTGNRQKNLLVTTGQFNPMIYWIQRHLSKHFSHSDELIIVARIHGVSTKAVETAYSCFKGWSSPFYLRLEFSTSYRCSCHCDVCYSYDMMNFYNGGGKSCNTVRPHLH